MGRYKHKQKLKNRQIERVCSCMWQIWLERNNKVFNDKIVACSISMWTHHRLLLWTGKDTTVAVQLAELGVHRGTQK